MFWSNEDCNITATRSLTKRRPGLKITIATLKTYTYDGLFQEEKEHVISCAADL
jgi:hypothetical protein